MLKVRKKSVIRETQLAATEYGKRLDNTSRPEGMRSLQRFVSYQANPHKHTPPHPQSTFGTA
jgi:hypothetical protein